MNRLAIFDCDGTLVDSGATIHAAVAGQPLDVPQLIAKAREKIDG